MPGAVVVVAALTPPSCFPPDHVMSLLARSAVQLGKKAIDTCCVSEAAREGWQPALDQCLASALGNMLKRDLEERRHQA